MASFLPTPDVVSFGLGLLVILLGAAITWRAYQGFRRNNSRPMLLLAAGMLLITVVPNLAEIILLPFVARVFPATGPAIEVVLIVSRTCEAIGIGILLLSLSIRHID